MSSSGNVILLESLDGSSHKLAERILAFGTEPVLVSNFEEAQTILQERRILISAVMIPTEAPSQTLKKQIKILRKLGPASGLMLVSVGKSPTDDERKKLRTAGMQLALWEPYDDGTLRFQLNRAICGDRDDHGRRHLRVPTYLLARVFVGGRTKDAVVYSLSEGGAFLETPRASMDGATVDIELRLPANHIRISGLVMFSNVPGNLQRPNLPMGMGIRFGSGAEEDVEQIRAYVKRRMAELDV
ncbi:MAG: PilZ domain-containing protein [Deltaproteobacteria bacterium]|nr:PilZ domain-containing protein [Deltaproteobacteria bacterium]MBW2383070.1 PilZ domain-containing protein [Deltaproteobacteria bacterium]MBW2696505.1 PilZ domain-containing protein [Deltaproteobacteria bacterium]